MAIFGRIDLIAGQSTKSRRLSKALDFASKVFSGSDGDFRSRAENLKAGESFEVEVDGREIFGIFQAYVPRERKDGFFEAHKEYTDVQLLFQGEELIEVKPLEEIAKAPVYDSNNNLFAALGDGASARLTLKPGLAAVLFPSDAHAPSLRAGPEAPLNIKLVVKVRNALD